MAASTASENTGFEWRTLLGPCHEWPAPNIEARAGQTTVERCEVCRQPVDSSKPYITNSAGEQPVHLACMQESAEAAEGIADPTGRRGWRRWLSFAHI